MPSLTDLQRCAICERRRIQCDGVRPSCSYCISHRIDCVWKQSAHAGLRAGREQRLSRRESSVASAATTITSRQHSPALPPSTSDVERLTVLLSNFHLTGFRLCAWSALLPLPRRSTAPSLIRTNKRKNSPRMTTWASYYLPHLATGATDDALSLALAAYSGLVLQKRGEAIYFYVKALAALRDILNDRPANMSNQLFLQCWAATILLADYEYQYGQVQTAARHIEGAAIFTKLSFDRFPIISSTDNSATTLHRETSDGPLQAMATLPRNERCLPAYLRENTLRLRTSNFLCTSSYDTWPQRLDASEDTIDNTLMDQLFEQCATCYWHVMTICTDYHTIFELDPVRNAAQRERLVETFASPLKVTLEALDKYDQQLQHVLGRSWGIYQQCAKPDHPFPGTPTFANPMLVVPWYLPHVLKIFLAPFLSQEDYDSACRSAKGLYKALEEIGQESLYEHDFPDCFIAALWQRGVERDSMADSIARRGPLFHHVVGCVWAATDSAEDIGMPMSKEAVLLLLMKTYRDELLEVIQSPKGKYLNMGPLFGQIWARLQRRGQFQDQLSASAKSWRDRVESWKKNLQELNKAEALVVVDGYELEPQIGIEVEQSWLLI